MNDVDKLIYLASISQDPRVQKSIKELSEQVGVSVSFATDKFESLARSTMNAALSIEKLRFISNEISVLHHLGGRGFIIRSQKP